MKIEVYSKSNCKYCTFTKNLLTAQNRPFTEYKLDIDYTQDELVEKYPLVRSYPAIVIDDEFIGGYDKLEEKLAKLKT